MWAFPLSSTELLPHTRSTTCLQIAEHCSRTPSSTCHMQVSNCFSERKYKRRRDKWYVSFCRQGNWGTMMIPLVNDRSRHKAGLSCLPASITRTLLLIWGVQAVTQHTTVSAPHFSFERKIVSAKFYLQPLPEWICLHAFSSRIHKERSLRRSLSAASFFSI